jgi:hypothetical protein
MTLNLSLYGAGIGLVMTGWIAGLVVGYLFSINIGLSQIPGRK